MNVETRGRAAAAALRAATSVDVEAALSRLRRTRRRRDVGRVVAACAVVAGLSGGVYLAVDRDENDVRPAEHPDPGNGPIVNAGGREFGGTPDLPSEPTYPLWQAVDAASGTFLYALEGTSRVAIVDESGPVEEVDCPFPCELGPYPGKVVFGPGDDELTFTVPSQFEEPPAAVAVVGYDGETRERLDISDPALPGRSFKLISWSPDGRQLAVAMESPFRASTAEVWIIPRDGSEARLAHREEAPQQLVGGRWVNTPVIVDLAWSPDGRRIGILVANELQGTEGGPGDAAHPLPRLVAVPADGGKARTLHTFDFRNTHSTVAGNYIRVWAFAWSPDGKRIAVTHEGGIAEISVTDGTVLTEHPGVDDYGPLVWLPDREADGS